MKKCRVCDIELTNDNWYSAYHKRNDAICMDCVKKRNLIQYYKDDSTAKIHDIIEKYGSDDNRKLMADLKELRKVVILETHFELGKLMKIIKDAVIGKYYAEKQACDTD